MYCKSFRYSTTAFVLFMGIPPRYGLSSVGESLQNLKAAELLPSRVVLSSSGGPFTDWGKLYDLYV